MPEYTADSVPSTPQEFVCLHCRRQLSLENLQPSTHFDPTWSALVDHLVRIESELVAVKRLVEEVIP
jgi:hypothetical protein